MKMIGFQLFALITLATACWLFAIPLWGMQSPLQVTTRLVALLVGCLLFGALLVLVARNSSASVWISVGLPVMFWLMQHKNIWRVTVLVLLLVAVIGPWAFDEINVPAEYTCSAPNIRLEGDYCGLPMSGTWILLMVIFHLASVVVGLVTGTAYFPESESGPLIYILNSAMLFVLAFLILLPLISTLLLILRGERRRWQVLHWVALGLAAGTGLLFGLSSLPRLYGALWGSWLYIGVTLCALVLELMMFLTAQRFQKIPNSNPISSQFSHKS